MQVNARAVQTILFLHGIPETSDIWDGVIGWLRTHYHSLAPDSG